MSRPSNVASWPIALVSALSLVAGLSAQDVVRAVSQAVVTPDNPLWAPVQDPPAPAPENSLTVMRPDTSPTPSPA